MIKGIERFRQAIKNQRDFGSGEFRLTYGAAEKIAAEIEDELAQLARLAWADGVPAPVDADGTVVPLDTKVMYTHMGKKIELSEFDLFHSVLSGGFVWRAIRNTGHGVNDLRLSCLHLRRPDSWELLEEDVERYETQECICAYYNGDSRDCDKCKSPAQSNGGDCLYTIARDVLRRARKLAERDAKGAGRG